jgi:ribosomal protein L37AE/L43A
MSDRFIYSCRDCGNAMVSGHYQPETDLCFACGATNSDATLRDLWVREGRIE